MRSLKTYLVAALAFASLSATAQTKKVVDRVDQRTVQELDHQDVTTKFKSHAFITLQGGAQYTLGEAKFKDLISPLPVQSLVRCPYSGQWMAEQGWLEQLCPASLHLHLQVELCGSRPRLDVRHD